MSVGELIIYPGPMYSGKCLGKGTPVIVKDEDRLMTIPVEEVMVGDTLVGPCNTVQKVISLTKGVGELYLVRQASGEDYVVNSDHILVLKHVKTGRTIDISIADYLKLCKLYPIFREEWKGVCSAVEGRYVRVAISASQFGTTLASMVGTDREDLFSISKRRMISTFGERQSMLNSIFQEGTYNGILVKTQRVVDSIVALARSVGIAPIVTVRDSGWIVKLPDVQRDDTYDITVEPYGEGEYYGFTLDGNGRFLLGDYTVTHNTTELMRVIHIDAAMGERVLYINHAMDTRSEDCVSTHSSILKTSTDEITYISSSTLKDVNVTGYSVIGIDESQFFDDLVEAVTEWVDGLGKRVIVVGLSGNCVRKPMGHILELIPLATEVHLLHSMCKRCAERGERVKAPFTKRLGKQLDDPSKITAESIGGADKYVSLCRKCYLSD